MRRCGRRRKRPVDRELSMSDGRRLRAHRPDPWLGRREHPLIHAQQVQDAATKSGTMTSSIRKLTPILSMIIQSLRARGPISSPCVCSGRQSAHSRYPPMTPVYRWKAQNQTCRLHQIRKVNRSKAECVDRIWFSHQPGFMNATQLYIPGYLAMTQRFQCERSACRRQTFGRPNHAY